jgi:hypothetical protein
LCDKIEKLLLRCPNSRAVEVDEGEDAEGDDSSTRRRKTHADRLVNSGSNVEGEDGDRAGVTSPPRRKPNFCQFMGNIKSLCAHIDACEFRKCQLCSEIVHRNENHDFRCARAITCPMCMIRVEDPILHSVSFDHAWKIYNNVRDLLQIQKESFSVELKKGQELQRKSLSRDIYFKRSAMESRLKLRLSQVQCCD